MAAKIKNRKSPEQRRAQMERLHESIGEQVEQLRESKAWEDMLAFMQAFRTYSLSNMLLILSQLPEAAQVAGYGKWRKEFGRQVSKGQRGIKIIGGRSAKVTETNEDTGEEEEKNTVRFFPCTVFDISQTEPVEGEAREIPELARKLTGDDPQGITEAVGQWLTSQGWGFSVAPVAGSANGYTAPDDRRVVVDTGMSPAQTAKTALHEAAHAVLHSEEDHSEYLTHRGIKETEAESAAYVVAGLLGLDTADYTIGYVAGWSGADAEVIKATAANVQRAANTIYDAITDTTAEAIEPTEVVAA